MSGLIQHACDPKEGIEPVFYVHGSESMRTYLGKSKFHRRDNCPALAGKVLMKDWIDGLDASDICKRCNTVK